MWYTPCGASSETTKVFDHNGSNASTSIVSGSHVRIGVHYHSDSLLDTTQITGDIVYASCTYYDQPYVAIKVRELPLQGASRFSQKII